MWERWRWRPRREREEHDLDKEIRSHLAIEARQRIERGEPPDLAWERARRSFGNLARIREETRESWGWTEMERLFEDLRHGLRLLL